jgi:excisionase family DNA binding protein
MDLETVIRETVRLVLREELRGALDALRPRGASEYLTVAQAAEVAAVAPDTIRRWVAEARLPRHNAGRELRVRRDDLESFMATAPCCGGDLTPEAAVARLLGDAK